MELFCSGIKNANGTIKYNLAQDDIPDTHKKILKSAIDKAIEDEKISHLAKSLIQTARQAIEDNITSTVLKFSKIFNEYSVGEVETEYEYLPKDKNYFINARIDCLLVSPDGEYVLIDFKNKKVIFQITFIMMQKKNLCRIFSCLFINTFWNIRKSRKIFLQEFSLI